MITVVKDISRQSILKRTLCLAFLLAAVVLGLGGSPSTAMASTTDPILHDQADSRPPSAKYAFGSATYDRSQNKVFIHLNTETPYLFVGARGQIDVTLDGQPSFGGPEQVLWQGSEGLTACAKLDPTCSSNPSQDWTIIPSNPWVNVPQVASSIHVNVSVS